MKWNNLKNNKCPKCFGYLTFNNNNQLHECLSCNDFSIGKERFDDLVNKMYKNPRAVFNTGDDKLSELNNLGREEVVEDFSDSPFLDY